VLPKSSGDCPEVFEFIEEPFDEISFPVQPFVEFLDVHLSAACHAYCAAFQSC
jgi:hypothetical protein